MPPPIELFDSWLKKLRERSEGKLRYSSKVNANTASSFGKRYLHLDVPVRENDPGKWRETLLDERTVSQRTFYPFLKMVKRNKRFHTDENGVRCRHPDGPKERPICCAAHTDSLVYSWYSFLLEDLLEQRLKSGPLNSSVLAYRKTGRNNIYFAKEVFDYVASKDECAVLAFDVKGFFDTLNHGLLKRAWAEVLGKQILPQDHYTVFKSMTQFRVLDAVEVEETLGSEEYAKSFNRQRIVYPRVFREKLLKIQTTNRAKYGIPQGAPLSAVLSNIYMYNLDLQLQEFAVKHQGIYRRYSDDLLLVVPEKCISITKDIVRRALDEIKLNINDKKTEVRLFSRVGEVIKCVNEKGSFSPVQYLGLEFDGKVIRIRSASLARFHHRLRRSVQKTVVHALYGGGSDAGKVFKSKLYEKYSHLGKCNFISYANRACFITGSSAIKKQLGDTVITVNNQVKRELARHAEPDFLSRLVKSKNFQKPRHKPKL